MNTQNTPTTPSQQQHWVAFIQAINGSPHNRIKMVDLATINEALKSRSHSCCG
jgi:hypothetical protein